MTTKPAVKDAVQAWMPGLPRSSAGLNLCHENAAELFSCRPPLDFLQVHPEHLIQERGGHYRDQVDQLREHYPVCFHGFGLSLGSIAPLDRDYLMLVRSLLKEHPEAFFSDHVSWSSLSHHHFHDLLPLIYSEETLTYFCERIDETQEAIDAPLLLENISNYMRFSESTLSESQFINELTRRTGAFVLLDVNNLYANAMNFGEDPSANLRAFNPESVRAYHLAGCTQEQGDQGSVWIDYHREPVSDAVWTLYAEALDRFGPWPTLLEWENNVPPLQRTLEEVDKAKALIRSHSSSAVMEAGS